MKEHEGLNANDLTVIWRSLICIGKFARKEEFSRVIEEDAIRNIPVE